MTYPKGRIFEEGCSLQQQTSDTPQVLYTSQNGPDSMGGVIDRAFDQCKTTLPVIAEFFLYLCQELGLSVTEVKGYRAPLNRFFSHRDGFSS